MPAILDLLEVSNQLEMGTVSLYTWLAWLVVTFNLEVLIRIKVYESIYIVCKVAISWLDLIRPLRGHDSLGLLSIFSLKFILIFFAVIEALGSSTELLDDAFVSLEEIFVCSHDLLQYVTLILVDDCLWSEATFDLLNEIFHNRLCSIKLISGTTQPNVLFCDWVSNLISGADLLKIILLFEYELV
jgi:hypothetical protein